VPRDAQPQQRGSEVPVGNSKDRSWIVHSLLVATVVTAGVVGYKKAPDESPPAQAAPAPVAVSTPRPASSRYRCTGKVYCNQMNSCAEATFYLRNCPGTKMDGDRDGIPCEKQWCGH